MKRICILFLFCVACAAMADKPAKRYVYLRIKGSKYNGAPRTNVCQMLSAKTGDSVDVLLAAFPETTNKYTWVNIDTWYKCGGEPMSTGGVAQAIIDMGLQGSANAYWWTHGGPVTNKVEP